MSVVPKPTPCHPPGCAPARHQRRDIEHHRRDPEGCGRATGANFEYLLATAKVESNLNPNLKARFKRDRAVPVHRADLARDDEEGRHARSASAIMPMRSSQQTIGALPGVGPAAAQRDHAAAHGPEPPMPPWPARSPSTTPPRSSQRIGRKPTDGELYIAHFFGTGRRRPADQRGKGPPASASGRDVSGRGARQPIDLLRSARQRAQRRRGLCRAQSPLPGGARQRGARRRADRGCRQHAAPTQRACRHRRRCRTPPARRRRSPSPPPRPVVARSPRRRSARCSKRCGGSRRGGAARCRRRRPSCGATPVTIRRGRAERSRRRRDRVTRTRAVAAPRAAPSRSISFRRHARRTCAGLLQRQRPWRDVPPTSAHCSRRQSAWRFNNSSIFPKIYGERFIKHRSA